MFYHNVVPILRSKYPNKLQVIFRQQVQPWHPSGTLVHESALAVLFLAPDKFWPFCEILFEHQFDFFDENVVNETRNDTYLRLAKLATPLGIDETEMMDLLRVSSKPHPEHGRLNQGNKITESLKLLTRMSRQQGIHFSPTVMLDGVIDDSVSSKWELQDWEEWLDKKFGGAAVNGN